MATYMLNPPNTLQIIQQTRTDFLKSLLFGAGSLLVAANPGRSEVSRFAATRIVQDQKLTVASSDGTLITCWRSGTGPPLLLIHGATADHTTTWRQPSPRDETCRGVAGALPRGKVLVMPGQQHAAMYVAPEEFVDQATRFLQE